MRSERLLIWLKTKYLGDAVMATPLLRVAREQFANLTVVGSPVVREVLKEDSDGIEFFEPAQIRNPSDVVLEAKRIEAQMFDSVLLVNRSFRSALIAKMSKIPIRVGHTTEFRGLLLTHRFRYDQDKFEAECYGELGAPISLTGNFGKVSLTVTDSERREGAELLQGATIGVQPGARHLNKRLPPTALAKVLTHLQEQGHRIAMFGGKEEQSTGQELSDMLNEPLIDLIGKTSIRQSLGSASNLRLMIGGSTGMMHMAVSVGCPSIMVFGLVKASKWGHNYAPHESVQIQSGQMQDMDPDRVIEAAGRALRTAETV